MVTLSKVVGDLHTADSDAESFAAGDAREFAKAQKVPSELLYHITSLLESNHLRQIRGVSRSLMHMSNKLRRKEIEPLIGQINTVTNGRDYQRAGTALALAGSIRRDFDVLEPVERDRLASFVTGLPDDRAFIRALDTLESGVGHFSVDTQNGLLDRAQGISKQRRPDGFLSSTALEARRATTRLVPYLSEESSAVAPRQRAFKDFVNAEATPDERMPALFAVAQQSDGMSESELDTAVDMVTEPDESYLTNLQKYLPPELRHGAEFDRYAKRRQASEVAMLGHGSGLSDQHRDRLLKTTQTFTSDADVSYAAAGILHGASLTAPPRWPGVERLNALVERADKMEAPASRARLMAAICSATDVRSEAGEYAPQRAVDAFVGHLKGLTGAEGGYESAMEFLNDSPVSPMANMSEADRADALSAIMDSNPADPNTRDKAIAATLGRLKFSREPIYESFYHRALDLPTDAFKATAIKGAAPRIAERMRDAEPAEHVQLAARAANLVDRALSLVSSKEFSHSLLGLKSVLPDISRQQKEAIVAHVLALPQDDPNRMPAIGFLLQSYAPLGRDLTKRLLDGTE